MRKAMQAFGMVGLTPADVDVAEVRDFTSYEELGFAECFGAHRPGESETRSVGDARIAVTVLEAPDGG
ncbi:hypothetical protein [Mycolicibacterium sp.]|uniref:hypothetical protein n=1 Tax=Mycolicibacterium sp. TaxID=2320850 RepID=UPI000A5F0DA3